MTDTNQAIDDTQKAPTRTLSVQHAQHGTATSPIISDTNQASEDEIREMIERLLRFNCPDGCDGNGSYPETGSDGDWEQGQCQWCFEYGMPARDAIQSIIRTEKLKLLDELDKSMPTAEQLTTKTNTRTNQEGIIWRTNQNYLKQKVT